jgi:hypothetical protein
MKRNIKILLLLVGLFGIIGELKAQTNNVDLLGGKELAEMSRMNPAFTAIINELRLNTSKGNDLNIGLEGKWFKSPTHYGLYFQKNNIDHLQRNKLNFQISRDKSFGEKFQFKYAFQLQHLNKTFTNPSSNGLALNFHDYNGLEYAIDSSNISQVLTESKSFDIGLGVGGVFKNLIIGANVRHLNKPKISIIEGSSERVAMSFEGQVGGFVDLFGTSLFPHLIFAQQGEETFLSGGVGVTRKNITFLGQYEQIGDLTQFDLGLNFRYERFMFAINYVYPQVDNYEFALSDIRLTLNTSLRKFRVKDNELLNKLQMFY